MRVRRWQILSLALILVATGFTGTVIGLWSSPSLRDACRHFWEESIVALPMLLMVLLLVFPVVLLALFCLETDACISSRGELEQLVQAKQQGKLLPPSPRPRPRTRSIPIERSPPSVTDSHGVLDRLLRRKWGWDMTA